MPEYSPSQRRAVLEGLQSGQAPAQGPRTQGLHDSDRIVVASFYNPYHCQRFRAALSDAGVDSETGKDGIKTTVLVTYENQQTASEILALQESQFPDRRPKGYRKDYDFTIFGGILGAVVGVVSLALSSHTQVMVFAWLGFFVSGLMVGQVTDQVCRRSRYFGPLQFNLTSCFLLTAVMAILSSIWVYFYRLL